MWKPRLNCRTIFKLGTTSRTSASALLPTGSWNDGVCCSFGQAREHHVAGHLLTRVEDKTGAVAGHLLTRVEGKTGAVALRWNRTYGTRISKTFTSAHVANQFVRWLLPEERATLLEALKELQFEQDFIDTGSNQPTSKQLKMVAVSNAIPFVGFGFLDNAIMILAGEYIDHTVGLTLGISTMAAAAVGNLISDLMGLGLAGYVESIAIKMGFDVPAMSTKQASMRRTKYTAYLGRGFGITIGCIIGMFPLLFIDSSEEEEKQAAAHEHLEISNEEAKQQ